MTYNWKLPAFFWLLLWKILKRLFYCLFIKGEVERPLQSRDCAGRVPLTLGHFIHRNFQADGLLWVLVFIFVCFWFGKTSIFTVHIIGQQKRDPRSGGRWTYALAGFSFSLGL